MGAVAINGTVLPREGAAPLLAVCAMDGDRLVSACVIDTGEVDTAAAIQLPRHVDRVNITRNLR
jgi:hypothetical protein